jgi:hypothetical protein
MGPTPVLFVDQTEELFRPDERGEVGWFLTLLANALVGTSPVLCLMSIRSGSFPLLQGEGHLANIKAVSFSLPPMLPASFRAVIEGPARLANIKLDPLLVEQLLLDTAHARMAGGDALPILAFTLERLYRQHGAKGSITLGDYERLGKSAGAIADAISEALEQGRAERSVPSNPAEADVLLKDFPAASRDDCGRRDLCATHCRNVRVASRGRADDRAVGRETASRKGSAKDRRTGN